MSIAIRSDNAPAPASFLSSAILAPNGTIYVSGSCGADPKTGKFIEGTVQDRTAQALKNAEALLKEAGASLKDVVAVTAYLGFYKRDFADFNVAYIKAFTDAGCNPFPSRTCIGVADLPQGTDVELTLTAVKPQ